MNAHRAIVSLGLLSAVLVSSPARATQDPPVKESQRRKPGLTASDVFAGQGEQLKAVTDSQIKVLQRLINVTEDADPEKPDLLFRMAELYAEQTRYYSFKVRDLDEKLSQAHKAGDNAVIAKLSADQKEYEKLEKQWLLAAVKEYVEVADGPKYQGYQKMDQVLFYLSYLLTQVDKEDQARVFFKRLVKNYAQSPFLPHAYLSFGEYFFEHRDYENADKFYDKVLGLADSPVHGYTLYKKGWVKYVQQDYAGAMEIFIKVIESVTGREKKKGDAQLAKESKKDLVRAYSRIGKPESAWVVFRKHGGDYAPTMMKQLSELYDELGQPEAAEATRKLLEKGDSLEEERPIEVLKVEVGPKPVKLGDEVTVTGSFRNVTGRLLLVNVRVLLPEQVVPVYPEVEQIVFMEAGTVRTVGWRVKVVGEGSWSVQVSPEVISKGRPLNGPPPQITPAVLGAFRKSWAGTWTSPSGFVYDAELRLLLHESGSVEGKLHWTLRKAPESRTEYAGKIGAKGIEYIWGTYEPTTRSLDMQGYRRDDPQQILGLDKYRLTLAETGDQIKGATWSGGAWKATFALSPMEKDPAKD